MTETTDQAVYVDGARRAFRIAAGLLDLKPQAIRLHAGEISARGMRDVLAVLAWRRRSLEELATGISYQDLVDE